MAESKITVQSKEKRVKNFLEVSLGFTKKIAIEEAKRCPQCADPVCMAGCPLGIDIPGFIRLLREGQVSEAFQLIKIANPLPAICGRICSAPCEKACVLNEENEPIEIRGLERYVADHGRPKLTKSQRKICKGKKIAIIGSGPAGLSAASYLAKEGYQVTVFEALEKPGGVLRYGIPEFRIPTKVLDAEIVEIQNQGVNFKTNVFIGSTLSFTDLKQQGFVAILLSTGAGVPKFMDLEGSHLGAVYYGEEFLMRINTSVKKNANLENSSFILGQSVAIIGSGNTALDCARSARRMGRDVHLIFRRTESEMRVRSQERLLAQEEGIKFEALTKPIQILSDQNHFVSGLRCVRMDYADVEGKWELMPVPDSEFMFDVDTVVIAVGHRPNAYAAKLENIKTAKGLNPTVITKEHTHQTADPSIFAAGNVLTNAGPVVDAIADGLQAAKEISDYLLKQG